MGREKCHFIGVAQPKFSLPQTLAMLVSAPKLQVSCNRQYTWVAGLLAAVLFLACPCLVGLLVLQVAAHAEEAPCPSAAQLCRATITIAAFDPKQ